MFSKILFPSLIFFLATSLTLTIACDIPILPPQHLFHIPSWQTQNFTCSAPPEVYIIKPSPNKGLGVFAARTLQPGTPIVHEAPLVPYFLPRWSKVSGSYDVQLTHCLFLTVRGRSIPLPLTSRPCLPDRSAKHGRRLSNAHIPE